MGGASRVVSPYLDEFEDGEDGRALLGVDAAQDAVELRVEAAVPQSQQEAAQQRDGHAGDRDTLVHTQEALPPPPWAGRGWGRTKTSYLGVRYGSRWVRVLKTMGASSGVLRKIR